MGACRFYPDWHLLRLGYSAPGHATPPVGASVHGAFPYLRDCSAPSRAPPRPASTVLLTTALPVKALSRAMPASAIRALYPSTSLPSLLRYGITLSQLVGQPDGTGAHLPAVRVLVLFDPRHTLLEVCLPGVFLPPRSIIHSTQNKTRP